MIVALQSRAVRLPTQTLAPSVASARAVARLRYVIAAALVIPALLFASVAWYLYRDTLGDARRDLETAANIAKEHALKLFDTNHMLLSRMLDLVGQDSDAALLARGREIHEQLVRIAQGLPQIQGLFINGRDARMVASNRVFPPNRDIDYGDREFFRFHRDNRGAVFVTEQLTSRATGEPFFDLSRRRELADGTFAGTVSVSLRPGYLTRLYEDLASNEPGLRMSLLRGDGRLVAVWPPLGERQPAVPGARMKEVFARGASGGTADGWSDVDGEPRMRVYRKLDDYPLYVVASFKREDVLARWRWRVALLALFAFPTSLGFAAMAWLALRRTRTELMAVQRLDAETAHRQRIEAALHQAQKFEAMGRLTGGVAHDFNNLLTIVTTSSYLAQRQRGEAQFAGHMAAIDRAVAAGIKLTRQLLAFSRRQALMPELIDLRTRMPALLALLSPLLGRAIEVESSVDDDAGPVSIDPAELELAFINLAINAKDAMPGGGRFTIRASNARDVPPDLAPGDYLLVEACDTGGGIEPDVLDRVFEPFFTTKPVGQGTGLGLSQVRSLCQSAGGDARIDSRVGEGTCVRMYLRRASGRQAPAAPRERVDLRKLECRVLLVEDNPEVAHAMGALLEEMGCITTAAASGDAARERLARHAEAFDIVLSDIEMPGGMDGIALAEFVRARYPRLPVILMTGYAARLEQAMREHYEVLPKPCAFDALVEAIGRALARRKAAVAEGG